MNAKISLLVLATALAASAGGWFAARRWAHSPSPAESSSERKPLFYQSAMHPWIKSEKPGNCTICGMPLTPVYQGEKGVEVSADIVSLSTNSLNVLHVQTSLVERRRVGRHLRFAGRIDDDDTRHRFVSATVDGRIDRLFVNYVGAEVVERQPLATFYSPILLAAEREYLSLFRSSHAAGLLDTHSNLLGSAAVRLQRLGYSTAQIERLRDKPADAMQSVILAPVSGTVVQRFVYEGQYVKEGDKLFELADFSTMWFLFEAYERDLTWLQKGQTVAVTTPALPGKVFQAPVVFIDPNLNEITRSVRVRVELPNPLLEEGGPPRRLLSHRLFAEGAVLVESPELLTVPRSAVLDTGTGAVAYIDLGGGSYRQRRVKLGQVGDEQVEVLEGLAEGERVVTAGNLLIDAQAQLNQSIAERPMLMAASAPAQATATGALTEAQKKAAREFLRQMNELAAALAADDLGRFETNALRVPELLTALSKEFSDGAGWRMMIERLDQAGRFARATDLASVRKFFLPLSEATVALARELRKQEREFQSLKIYECSMASRAFPGAPDKAGWLQLAGPVRNPYFGRAMLDCGNEVAP